MPVLMFCGIAVSKEIHRQCVHVYRQLLSCSLYMIHNLVKVLDHSGYFRILEVVHDGMVSTRVRWTYRLSSLLKMIHVTFDELALYCQAAEVLLPSSIC